MALAVAVPLANRLFRKFPAKTSLEQHPRPVPACNCCYCCVSRATREDSSRWRRAAPIPITIYGIKLPFQWIPSYTFRAAVGPSCCQPTSRSQGRSRRTNTGAPRHRGGARVQSLPGPPARGARGAVVPAVHKGEEPSRAPHAWRPPAQGGGGGWRAEGPPSCDTACGRCRAARAAAT